VVRHNGRCLPMSSFPTNPALPGDAIVRAVRGAVADSFTGADTRHAELQAEVLCLFDELRDRLLRYAISFGLSVHDAEDVLQEVFLALFRHLKLDRSRENLHGWTFRTTHNLALKRRASMRVEQRRVPSVAEADPVIDCRDVAPGPEEHLLFHERQERLRAVVHALPENDQMCLRLRAEGWRYREIASTLGISLGSVAASLARSFERLKRTDAR
jgi:RNA polymerase sigma-70 factor (ECF subfamily)